MDAGRSVSAVITRLLPDRREAVARLAVHLGPDGDGLLPDPPGEQLRWSRSETVVAGWVLDAVAMLQRPGGAVHTVARPAGDGVAVAVWCAGPGWTVLARLTGDEGMPVAVLVADANPGAVTDLTVPGLRGPVVAALHRAVADHDRRGGQPAPDIAGG